MKTTTLCLFAALLAPLAGCGDDTGTMQMDQSPPADLSMTSPPDMTMTGPPAAPTLGAQIDRMGRPGVNTALTDPFWDNGTNTVDMHHAKQDAYNAVSDPTKWASTMIGGSSVLAIFKGTLAAYDGLDNTCGNQAAFGGPLGAAYTTLATVLADDELYVDTTQTACTTYLGVELKTLGVNLNDCGGRTLTENTIDETYNLLALGAPTGPVTSGITSDGDGAPSNTTFPYLGAPNQ